MEAEENKMNEPLTVGNFPKVMTDCLESFYNKIKEDRTPRLFPKKTEKEKEPSPLNWSAVQGLAQLVIALVLVYSLSLSLTGCSVSVPERSVSWVYTPSATLASGMSFDYDPVDDVVLVKVDGELLKAIGDGDSFQFLPYHYRITTEGGDTLVRVMNGSEELARFTKQ